MSKEHFFDHKVCLWEQIRRVQAKEAKPEEYFWDWFCEDKTLPRRAQRLLAKAASIAFSPRFKGNEVYTFFKNNCPLHGPLYDDFRICSLESGDVNFTVQFDCFRSSKPVQVWGPNPETPDKDFIVLFEGTWHEVQRWFLQ